MALIRRATDADLDRLLEMGERFRSTSTYGEYVPHPPLQSREIAQALLAHGAIFVAEHDGRVVGLLALHREAHIFTGEWWAHELLWWVDPEARHASLGPRLLSAGEAWSRTEGCAVLRMISPAKSDVGRFLERRGYRELETSYLTRL